MDHSSLEHGPLILHLLLRVPLEARVGNVYGVAEGEVEEEEIDEGDQGGEGAPEEVDVEGGGGRDGLGVDLIKRRTTGSS